jgi:hypothetical protein
MNNTSAILQSSTSVTGSQFAISQPAQSPGRCKQPLPTFYKICFGNLNFSTLFCQRFVAAHTAAAQSQTQSKAAVRAATPTHNRADYNTISSCAKREQQNFFKHIQYVRIEGHFAFVDPKKK